MPVLKARCPECDARVRRTVDEPGEYKMRCPKCGHAFRAELEDEDDDRPARYRPKGAKKSNAPIVAGMIAGALLLVGAIVGLALAFKGADEKPVAQAAPPAKAKANPAPAPQPAPPKQAPPADPNPEPVPPAVDPPIGPPVRPPAGPPVGLPEEPPADVPPVAVPPRPPGEDVFARAATFKPDGPLPELPPLPPADRRPLLALDPGGHTAFVRFVGFTPDAGRVVSVSEDKSVRLWDVFSGEAVYTVRLPAGPDAEGTPHAAALSPDGTRLAVGGFPAGGGKSGIPIYILSVETGELLATIDGARQAVHALDFSRDGDQLAVGCGRGLLQVYDFPSKKWICQFPSAHSAT
ncbi:MAG: hypothetical protein J0I06_03115, partial [Planctomycetes bacterium]|nr:hypothetical protein [Planctomycetota bacterium]